MGGRSFTVESSFSTPVIFWNQNWGEKTFKVYLPSPKFTAYRLYFTIMCNNNNDNKEHIKEGNHKIKLSIFHP